jgi:hypothetical protein
VYCAVGALNQRGHYVSSMGTGQLNALRTAFERMTDVDIMTKALLEVQTFFCTNAGYFSSPLAQKMVINGKTSADMHIQLHLLVSDLLTSKLITCSHHLQLHGVKYLVTQHLHFRSLQ